MQRVSINGITAEYVSVMDRSIHYGDGLFETLAYRNGVLQLWNEHINRMRQGADVLGIDFPGEEKYLEDIQNLLMGMQNENHVIKLLLTRGAGERGYRSPRQQKPMRAVFISHWPDYPEKTYRKQGIKVCLCKHPVSSNPSLAGIKHLNRLDNVLARDEWDKEYQEGLMLDVGENVIEGTMSNIFGVKDGAVYTPELSSCGVKGIVRDQVLNIAEDSGCQVYVQQMSINDMYSMDEIFITNSIIGIWPVAQLGNTGFQKGDLTGKLEIKLRKRMNKGAEIFT